MQICLSHYSSPIVDDKVINSKGVLDEPLCKDIVKILTSSDVNITLFDTAEGYGGGTSEKRVGRLLIDNNPNPANKPVLMTKFLPCPWRLFMRDMENAARASCRRMNVKCIDVYLMHSPVHWRPIEYWVQAGAICRKKGLIRAMGLSNW